MSSDGIPRDAYDHFKFDEALSPQTWRSESTKVGELYQRSALICCPNGHIISLAGLQIVRVDRVDGFLQESVMCPAEKCGFAGNILLLGWGAAEEPVDGW